MSLKKVLWLGPPAELVAPRLLIVGTTVFWWGWVA